MGDGKGEGLPVEKAAMSKITILGTKTCSYHHDMLKHLKLASRHVP